MGRVEQTVEVNASVDACYAIWTDFENFPRFMKNVESVTRTGSERGYRWQVKGPLGKSVCWDSEVDAFQPNQAVSWHSVKDAEVKNAGAVTFKQLGPNRTHINVSIEYDAPAGLLGEAVAAVLANPEAMVKQDLENFRLLVEKQPANTL